MLCLEYLKLLSMTNMQRQKKVGKLEMVFHSTVNATFYVYAPLSLCLCVCAFISGCLAACISNNSFHYVIFFSSTNICRAFQNNCVLCTLVMKLDL